MQILIPSFLSGVFLLGILFSFWTNTTYAALLYIDPAEDAVYRGDSITLQVRLDTDIDECINTVDAVIEYDSSIRAIDVSRGDSILSIWVEDPKINAEERTITFAGGIPGGYCGRIPGDPRLTNVIAELVFRLPGFNVGGGNSNEAQVVFGEETQILLHDGLGTKATTRTRGATLSLLGSPGSQSEDEWSDRVADDNLPPSDFLITLYQDDSAFGGDYFIAFNTQDKQSGIDHYEVMEEPFDDFFLFNWGRADAPWVRTVSPYVLSDQTLNSTIRVKAIDKAGNETIALLIPDRALRSFSMQRVFTQVTIATIVILTVGLVGYALWRRKQSLIENYEEE